MYEIVNVQYTGTYNNGGTNIPAVLGEFRASIAADLPAQNVDCHIICGCDGLDISTGDKYIWNGTAWILQPSYNAWQNVYTKAEIDTMITTIYQIMMYYHTTQESADGTITFYTLGGNVGRLTIYGNGLQGETPEFVGDKTANLFNESLLQNNMHLDNLTGLPVSYTGRIASPYPIDVSQYASVAIGYVASAIKMMYSLFSNNELLGRFTAISSGTIIDVSNADEIYICFYSAYGGNINTSNVLDIIINAGSALLPYEKYGYRFPITCAGHTVTLYLNDPLRKALDGSDSVDILYSNGTIIREVDANGNALTTPITQTIDFPDIPTVNGENTLTVDTTLPPSKIIISGE